MWNASVLVSQDHILISHARVLQQILALTTPMVQQCSVPGLGPWEVFRHVFRARHTKYKLRGRILVTTRLFQNLLPPVAVMLMIAMKIYVLEAILV